MAGWQLQKRHRNSDTHRQSLQKEKLAQDFLDLTFALERGEQLRGLLRHEQAVRVYMHPGDLSAYRRDVENLLARFRAEAGTHSGVCQALSQGGRAHQSDRQARRQTPPA